MRSITEQAPLDEFLSTAELAGTDFTAEKMNNVKIIHPDQRNLYLLSADEERLALDKHAANRGSLTVPRRPPWHENMSKEELDGREKASFLNWRRGLAELQETHDLLMTPFERNLEVWRQLWRVVERSDLVVQIVDARNPLLFRSDDLEKYVKEVDTQKENLLLVNKADLMTLNQRRAWANYFQAQGITYKYFSAASSTAGDNSQDFPDGNNHCGEPGGSAQAKSMPVTRMARDSSEDGQQSAEITDSHDKTIEDCRTTILSPEELEQVFLTYTPKTEGKSIPLESCLDWRLTDSRCRVCQAAPGRSCGIPQRRQILNDQCLDWHKESLCFVYSRKDKTLPDYPPQLLSYSMRLSRLGLSQLCHYESRACLQWNSSNRSVARVYRSCRASVSKNTPNIP